MSRYNEQHIQTINHPNTGELMKVVADVGIGGAVNFMIPELKDWYENNSAIGWKIPCYNAVKEHKDDFYTILKMTLSEYKSVTIRRD